MSRQAGTTGETHGPLDSRSPAAKISVVSQHGGREEVRTRRSTGLDYSSMRSAPPGVRAAAGPDFGQHAASDAELAQPVTLGGEVLGVGNAGPSEAIGVRGCTGVGR
jgi:hypothetical protein